ncbi:MAG: hypothetical protein F6J97_00435 [Leptolyngbya sp. SIO4C1]|nr:hypothetical protein [Leptolyngbya sp. SIO4C1]
MLLLIGVTALALVIPDLAWGGRRSSVARYLIPAFVGVQLAIAYCLSWQMSHRLPVRPGWQRKAWQLTVVTLYSVGILSCSVSAQATTWWNKYNSIYLVNVAAVVNQAEKPTLVTAGYPPIDLAYQLDPTVTMQSPSQAILPDSSVYVFSRSYSDKVLRETLAQNPAYQVVKTYEWRGKVEPAYETKVMLWQLAPSA